MTSSKQRHARQASFTSRQVNSRAQVLPCSSGRGVGFPVATPDVGSNLRSMKGDRVEAVVDTGQGVRTDSTSSRREPVVASRSSPPRGGRGARGDADGHSGAHRPVHDQPPHRPRRASGDRREGPCRSDDPAPARGPRSPIVGRPFVISVCGRWQPSLSVTGFLRYPRSHTSRRGAGWSARSAGRRNRPGRRFCGGCAAPLALSCLPVLRRRQRAGDALLGRPGGGFPDEDGPGRGDRLEPGRRVDEIPGHHPLAGRADGHRRFTGQDPGAGGERGAEASGPQRRARGRPAPPARRRPRGRPGRPTPP